MNKLVSISVFAICVCSLSSCGSNNPVSGEGSEKLNFEVVSIEPTSSSSEKVRVTFKMTNKSDQKIVRVKAKISVLDGAGTEIGSEEHWVIRSGTSGSDGLEPGATAEEDYLIDVTDKTKAAKAEFKLETVRGG